MKKLYAVLDRLAKEKTLIDVGYSKLEFLENIRLQVIIPESRPVETDTLTNFEHKSVQQPKKKKVKSKVSKSELIEMDTWTNEQYVDHFEKIHQNHQKRSTEESGEEFDLPLISYNGLGNL